jgi:hypothetical protein
MEPPLTQPKRWHCPSSRLAAVLVGLTVLFPTLGALDRLFSAGVEAPTALLPTRPFDDDGLAIEGTIESVNPVAGSMAVRLSFLPTGTLGRGKIPTRDITVLLSDLAGRNVLRFRAGQPMDLTRISLVLPRTPLVRYPFDQYATEMLVGAVQHVGDATTPLLLNLRLHEEVSGWEFTAEPDDARGEALAGSAAELAGVPLKPAVGRIEVRRSGEVMGYALGLAVLMLGLAVGTLFLLWNFVVQQRPLEAWFATYGVGVVFSLPRLRDSLPNAPPLGTAYDYLVYYWALAVTAIALLLILGTWFVRAQRRDR